jgi:hypothetical protein
MKVDGLDWMDWLHKVRHEAEEKRVRDGLSVEGWLRHAAGLDDEVRAGLREREHPPVARDKPGTEDRKP